MKNITRQSLPSSHVSPHLFRAGLFVAASLCMVAAPSSTPSRTEEEPVLLDVFHVDTDRAHGYQAMSTTSGTRTNELLRDLPMAVTVLTQEYLQDLAATDPAAILNYGVNLEPGNQSGIGNDYGGGGNAVFVRGVQSSWNSRDGFIWYAISDNYNTENIEILRGPSGNIYGDGRVGGVLNIATKRAKLRDYGQLQLRWDSEDSLRGSLDLNRRLSRNGALRLNLLKSNQLFWKDTAYDRREGAAIAYLHEFTRRSRFSGSIEYNRVRRVNTRGLLVDGYSTAYVPGTGTPAAGTVPGTAVIQAAGSSQRWTLLGDRLLNLESGPGQVFRVTSGAGQNNAPTSLIPRHQQWNGPDDQLNHDSIAVNAAYEQQFGERATFELAFNLQVSRRTDQLANQSQVLRDVNPLLPDGRGGLVPNPDYDALYVEHRFTSTYYYNSVPSYRATLLRDFDFGVTRQRLIASLSLRDERFRLIQRQEMLAPAAVAALGLTGAEARPTNNRVWRRYYLSNGNGALGRVTRDDIDFTSEIPGGQRTHQPFYSGSALAFGRYWQNRIVTTVGVRRDNFDRFDYRLLTDPVTGLGFLERAPDGSLVKNQTLNLWTTRWNYGIVFSPWSWGRVFWNYAENFQQNGAGDYFNGDARLPRTGEGVDYGLSLYLWENRLSATLTRFDNAAKNETATAIANQQQADEMNALLGTQYTTAAVQDTRSRTTEGWELELVANPTRAWTISFKWSQRRLVNTDFVPRLTAALDRMRQLTSDPSLYSRTFNQYATLVVENLNSRNAWNVTTRYSFLSGPLKGARVGFYGYPKKEQTFSFAGRPDLTFEGYFMANAFAGFGYRLFGRHKADVQLNIENLLNKQTVIGNSYTNRSYLAPVKCIVTHRLDF